MYRITKDDQLIGYLLGTLHICQLEILEVPEIRSILGEVRGVYTETLSAEARLEMQLSIPEGLRSMEEDLLDYAETHQLLTGELEPPHSVNVINRLNDVFQPFQEVIQQHLEPIITTVLEPFWINEMSSTADVTASLMDLMGSMVSNLVEAANLHQRDQFMINGILETSHPPGLFSIGWGHVNGVTKGLREAGYQLKRIPLTLPHSGANSSEFMDELLSVVDPLLFADDSLVSDTTETNVDSPC